MNRALGHRSQAWGGGSTIKLAQRRFVWKTQSFILPGRWEREKQFPRPSFFQRNRTFLLGWTANSPATPVFSASLPVTFTHTPSAYTNTPSAPAAQLQEVSLTLMEWECAPYLNAALGAVQSSSPATTHVLLPHHPYLRKKQENVKCSGENLTGKDENKHLSPYESLSLFFLQQNKRNNKDRK